MSDVHLSHPPAERLAAFLAGTLEPSDYATVREHLARCPACQAALDDREQETLAPSRPSGANLAAGPFSPQITPPITARGHEKATLAAPLPAAVPVPSDVPPDLANHPRYRVLQLLGRGGMGAVYKAEHRLMERLVALKVINPQLVDDAASVQRFHQEVKAAAKLAHPNIVTAHDADQAGDIHFLVMEFVEGNSLAQLLEKRGPFPILPACEYVRQAALGLQHAFEKGMVHRDIKPHNLMLAPKGRVKILDFGLARFVRERGTRPDGSAAAGLTASGSDANRPADSSASGSLTLAGSIMGTPDYMAPEQATDARKADTRADIYSLGCTLYHLLAGKVPFTGDSALTKILAHVEHKARPVTDFRPDVPPALVEVLERMMAKDPSQRYQTPADVARALMPFVKPGAEAPARDPGPVTVLPLPHLDEPSPPRPTKASNQALQTFAEPGRKRGPKKSKRDPEASWPSRHPVLTALLIALVIALPAVAGFAIYRISTDQGELIITAHDPDVEVTIRHDGKEVAVMDLKTRQKVVLKSGAYDLLLPGGKKDLRLSTDRFVLKRGDTVIVEVMRKEPALVQGPSPPVTPETPPEPPPPEKGPKSGRPKEKSPGGTPVAVKPAAPPGQSPVAVVWPAQALAEGKFRAPELARIKPVYTDDFHDPKSGWPHGTHGGVFHGYQGGKYVITPPPPNGYHIWTTAKPFGPFACQVEGHVAAKQGQWGLAVHRKDKPTGVVVLLGEKGNLVVFPSGQDSEKVAYPRLYVRHKAIQEGAKPNKLLVIGRGKMLEIYVNGVAVCDPVLLDYEVTPAVLLLGAQAKGIPMQAEFSRITVWPADRLSTPQERGAIVK